MGLQMTNHTADATRFKKKNQAHIDRLEKEIAMMYMQGTNVSAGVTKLKKKHQAHIIRLEKKIAKMSTQMNKNLSSGVTRLKKELAKMSIQGKTTLKKTITDVLNGSYERTLINQLQNTTDRLRTRLASLEDKAKPNQELTAKVHRQKIEAARKIRLRIAGDTRAKKRTSLVDKKLAEQKAKLNVTNSKLAEMNNKSSANAAKLAELIPKRLNYKRVILNVTRQGAELLKKQMKGQEKSLKSRITGVATHERKKKLENKRKIRKARETEKIGKMKTEMTSKTTIEKAKEAKGKIEKQAKKESIVLSRENIVLLKQMHETNKDVIAKTDAMTEANKQEVFSKTALSKAKATGGIKEVIIAKDVETKARKKATLVAGLRAIAAAKLNQARRAKAETSCSLSNREKEITLRRRRKPSTNLLQNLQRKRKTLKLSLSFGSCLWLRRSAK